MKRIFKYASLLIAAAMLLVSCYKDNNPNENPGGIEIPEGAELILSSDKSFIQTFDGDFAQLSVTIADIKLTKDVNFFDAEGNQLDLADFKFSTKVSGEYEIWANYGTYNSNKIKITAVSVTIPDAPKDPQPSKKSFKTRVLITEFTGTGCGICPQMKELIHETLELDGMKEKVVEITSHTFNTTDKAYYNDPDFPNAFGNHGYPYVIVDFYQPFSDYRKSVAEFAGIVNSLYDAKKENAAGISVNSVADGDELVIRASMKAAETASYRIGAILVEDGIYGKQSSATADWMHTHNGVISHIDGKYYTSRYQYYGHSLGKVEKGKTADYLFDWNLKEIEAARLVGGNRKEFVRENLHLVIYVSSIGKDSSGKEFYYINNVVEAPLTGQLPFEYR